MTQNTFINGDGLKNLFLDLRAEYFTGVVNFECEEGQKSVFVQSGEITHCSSRVLDDRLGDVIYREGQISLDLFVDFAGKVNDRNRFGDLLIQSKMFSMVELWEALNLQSREILQSLVFQKNMSFELADGSHFKTPDFGLRFRWDQAIDDALEELRFVRRFERAARESPILAISEQNRGLANSDFLREMLALVEEHGDFNSILEETRQLSKVYTLRALFKLYSMGVIVDTWGLFAQDLSNSAENELQEVVNSANRVFLLMEALIQERNLTGWDTAVKSAVRILEREFGPGIQLVPKRGVNPQDILKTIILNREFKMRTKECMASRWPISLIAIVQEGLQKALLYLLFEVSNNRAMEEEAREIHAELVKTRGSYFSRVAEAIS